MENPFYGTLAELDGGILPNKCSHTTDVRVSYYIPSIVDIKTNIFVSNIS